MTNFHIMTKPSGAICNLDCVYCFYLEKEKLYSPGKSFKMPDDVLESFVRQYIQSQTSATIHFAWQGGEPTLMGIAFFQRAVELQKKYSDGRVIENALQTNGTLLDDSWGEFLAKNNFLVGVSIDGPAYLHDAYRVDKGGQPTHSRVLRGLHLLQEHGVEFNTLTVVHRKNSYHAREVYSFLKEIGSKYLQFIPVVEQISTTSDANGLHLLKPFAPQSMSVSEWSVESLQYGKFLQEVFDEWVRADVARVFVQVFDVAFESWMGMDQSLCVFARTCGSAMALEHNGDLYSCDHFVYPDNKLGNILQRPMSTLSALPQQLRFGKGKELGLPSDCVSCDVRFACNGECPKHRFLTTATGEPGLNYLCAGYKHFFHHIDPYMKYMVSELQQNRPPANVMSWANKFNPAAV
jgi:uncharacterized protein